MATFNYVPDIFVNAVRQGDLDKVRDMLSERFYRYAECIDFDTREHVFILGASEGHIDIVKALVAAKTNIYVKSNSGKSAMDIAKTPDMIEYLKELYAPEADNESQSATMPTTPLRQASFIPGYEKSESDEADEEPEEIVKVKSNPDEAEESEAVKVKSEPDEEADESEESDEEAGMVPNPDASKALMDLLHVPMTFLELKFAPDNNMFMPIPVNVTKDVPGIHMKVMVRNEGVPPMLMNAVVLNKMHYVIVEAIEDSILVRKLHPCILA